MDRLQDFADLRPDAASSAVEPPPAIGGDERRMHVRAYNYWVSLLGGRAFPAVDDLDLDDLADFGPNSVLLDFTHGGEQPAIAWLGERLRNECDLPHAVASVEDVPPRSLLSRLTDHHLQIIANRAPIGFEAEFENARGFNTMYRGILLPFSSDDETIDFIYGVINWKEVASPEVTVGLARELAADTTNSPTIKPRPMVSGWADGPSGQAPRAPAAIEAEERHIAPAPPASEGALADWLASARAIASAALSADSRSRAALYQALALTYDFALLAEARDGEYRELLADSGVSSQARAPMTPIVKLIFGTGYDKTRITEFAAALTFARRRTLPAGGMKLFLENFPGGLKAIVAAERRERRPEGKPERPDAIRDAARALEGQAFLTLPGDDEFVILVARRVDAERVAVIGVVPDDKPLLDRALKAIADLS